MASFDGLAILLSSIIIIIIIIIITRFIYYYHFYFILLYCCEPVLTTRPSKQYGLPLFFFPLVSSTLQVLSYVITCTMENRPERYHK